MADQEYLHLYIYIFQGQISVFGLLTLYEPYMNMLWGKEEPTITREPGSHARRQGPWKPISVLNRFGINGKEKPPFNGKLHIYFLSLSTTLFRSASFYHILP